MLAATDVHLADAYTGAQAQSLAVLFIVENSQAVLEAWPDVLYQYLGSIVESVSTSTTESIRYFLTESSTEQGYPREFASIQDAWSQLRFDPNPKNRLSFNKVWSSVEFFARPNAFLPHVSRHIVIVAASPPLEDNASVRPVNLTPWHTLAKQLTQASLKCHMILSPTQSMIPFEALFDATLTLQGGFEDQFPVPFDTNRIMIKLSGTHHEGLTDSGAPHALSMPTSHFSLQRRNNSFPSDLYLMNQRIQHSGEHFTQHSQLLSEASPSIVTHLQHIHGVTKKKPFGGKSPRKSFFKDERISPDSNDAFSLTNSGGRVPSLSKVDRATRIAQAGSPTDVFPRRPGFPRRNSRLSSSPELPGSGPPSSQSPSNPSPVSPMSDIYPAPVAVPHGQQMQVDPTWLQAPYQISQNDYSYPMYTAVPPPVALTLPSNVAAASHGGNTGSTYQYANHAHRPSSPPTSAKASAKSRHRRSLCPEDDEPFTFDASYVAATAELWESEVIPMYPDVPSMKATSTTSAAKVKVDPPRARNSQNTSYIPEPVDCTPGTTWPNPSYAGSHETYATSNLSASLQYPVTANDRRSTDMNVYPTYSSGSSSSLIGWAG